MRPRKILEPGPDVFAPVIHQVKHQALDFIRTPHGAYVFLEVNPNGQWLWLEDRLGFPISQRVADWPVSRAREL